MAKGYYPKNPKKYLSLVDLVDKPVQNADRCYFIGVLLELCVDFVVKMVVFVEKLLGKLKTHLNYAKVHDY
jgi:hypothetical protein